jgi:radical SAM protein with 4Fe4S-binding SPASM domain
MGKENLPTEEQIVYGTRRAAIYNPTSGEITHLPHEETKKAREQGTYVEAIPPDKESSEGETRLRFLLLEITSECNLRCLHCYGCFGPPVKPAQQISTEKWKDVLSQSAKMGHPNVLITGGEPFLHPQTDEILTHASTLGFESIGIFTNSTSITEDQIHSLKNLGVRVSTSLYSHNPNIHDTITQTPGSHQSTVATLNILKEHGVPTKVVIIAMKHNEGTVEKTVDFVHGMGLSTAGPYALRPVGRGVCQDLQPNETIRQKYDTIHFPLFTLTSQQFLKGMTKNTCWAGKVSITSTGDAIPCVFAREYVVGNITTSNLRGIVEGQRLQNLWSITKDLVDNCKDCELRYNCKDCRAEVISLGQDLFSASPRCPYDPHLGQWQDEKQIEPEIAVFSANN